MIAARWVQDRKQEWGEESPLYQTKVLGQFPSASEHGLIALAWILAAQARAGCRASVSREEVKIGADIARSGADRTVFLFRRGSLVDDIQEHQNLNTMETVGKLIQFAEQRGIPWEDVSVDEIGIGAGVVDRLREQGRHVRAVNFGASAVNSEKFQNMRAECY
jgi:hypothetical protein